MKKILLPFLIWLCIFNSLFADEKFDPSRHWVEKSVELTEALVEAAPEWRKEFYIDSRMLTAMGELGYEQRAIKLCSDHLPEKIFAFQVTNVAVGQALRGSLDDAFETVNLIPAGELRDKSYLVMLISLSKIEHDLQPEQILARINDEKIRHRAACFYVRRELADGKFENAQQHKSWITNPDVLKEIDELEEYWKTKSVPSDLNYAECSTDRFIEFYKEAIGTPDSRSVYEHSMLCRIERAIHNKNTKQFEILSDQLKQEIAGWNRLLRGDAKIHLTALTFQFERPDEAAQLCKNLINSFLEKSYPWPLWSYYKPENHMGFFDTAITVLPEAEILSFIKRSVARSSELTTMQLSDVDNSLGIDADPDNVDDFISYFAGAAARKQDWPLVQRIYDLCETDQQRWHIALESIIALGNQAIYQKPNIDSLKE